MSPPAAEPLPPLCTVALESSLDKTLTYGVPRSLDGALAVGMRVRVPLGRGNRPAMGYVVDLPDHADVSAAKLKYVLAVADERVLLTPALMQLAQWMGRYYISPLGAVLDTLLPAAVKKRTGLGHLTQVRLAVPRDEAQRRLEATKRPKQRAVLARLLQVPDGQQIEIGVLATESGTRPATVRKLATAAGGHLITLERTADLGGLAMVPESDAGTDADLPLNAEQQAALDQISRRLDALAAKPGTFDQCLLMGVTGSGKTEVYLQAIRRVVAAGKQAIVLVPEIALTPQTVRRFTGRFPRVCVLHSGLTATERHRQWHTILSGKADVVVGARSAVFAPVPRLGIIVVDEEHESSYKQDQAPRYNARDLAIKRAQLESCLCVLGSATPALETYHRATQSGSLLRLRHRVRGIQMPKVELVDLKEVARLRKGIHLLSPRLESLLKSTLAANHQAILLLNRRGYSSFVYCGSCSEALQCKFCDASLTYHRNTGQAPGEAAATHRGSLHTGQLHCHYCLAVNPLPPKCPTCGKLLSLFGLGTQKVEEELLRKFPGIRFARVDSDTMRTGADYAETLRKFGAGELQVLLGTQMIAKGLDYPNVTLVGVISGDTALSLPDFRAAERTFQLITQVAGRAGRGNDPGRVVLQTFNPHDDAITAALNQDYDGFAARELKQRQAVGLPPFARLARIILRDQDETHLQTAAAAMADAVAAHLPQYPDVRLRGPMPCAINRIAGYHRANLVLSAPTALPLQRILTALRNEGHLKHLDRVAVDVDPVSLL